jgi:hypothetical protein
MDYFKSPLNRKEFLINSIKEASTTSPVGGACSKLPWWGLMKVVAKGDFICYVKFKNKFLILQRFIML